MTKEKSLLEKIKKQMNFQFFVMMFWLLYFFLILAGKIGSSYINGLLVTALGGLLFLEKWMESEEND